MTQYDLSNNTDFEKLKNDLIRTFQSCNLNILIGAGASLPAIEVLGDIEGEIDQLLLSDKKDEAIIKSYTFLKNIYECNVLLDKDDAGEKIDITKKNYYDFLNLLYIILQNRKNYKIEPQVNIYTTNYDLFLEYTLENISRLINYNDGFTNKNNMFVKPNINIAEFNKKISYKTELYDYVSNVPNFNILKLHGSLNWQVGECSKIVFQPPKNILDKLNNNETLAVEDMNTILNNIGVVLPNYNKFEKTVLAEVYFSFLRYFSTNLLKTNSLIFALGFSFNDNHIKELVKTALRTNPTLQLLISIYDFSELDQFVQEFENYSNVSFIFNSATKLDLKLLNEYLTRIFEGFSSDK